MSFTESLLRRGDAPIVIAHRGASAHAPENTMPAFRAAFDAGASWVETDVQPTADGALVLLHDDTVDRTTDGSGPIRSLTAQATAELDAGRWFDDAFTGARVPRLAELLAHVGAHRRVLLEIKGEHTAADLRRTLAEIDAAGCSGRVFLQSFEVPALRTLRALRPRDPFGLLVETVGADPVAECRELGATAYNPDFSELLRRPDTVEDLHGAGIATTPWTADDPEHWATLTDLGVDGIITNRPAELLAWQAARRA